MAFLDKIKSTYTFNPQSWNLYSYVNGNPVNFNDPMGHYINPPHSAKVALAGVPNVDVSGMLTEVEMYEFFSGNILYGNIPTAQQYYQAIYSAAQESAARGFHFYSPYGYTANSEVPDWSNPTSSANGLVFSIDPLTGSPYSNEIPLSYEDANFLADITQSLGGGNEIGFYYRQGLLSWDSSETPGKTQLNPFALQFSSYYGHVHPQAGTLINGMPNPDFDT